MRFYEFLRIFGKFSTKNKARFKERGNEQRNRKLKLLAKKIEYQFEGNENNINCIRFVEIKYWTKFGITNE